MSMHAVTTKPRLGEWMCAQGMISHDQLQIALIEQQKQSLLLGQLLVRLQFVSDAVLRDALARQLAQASFEVQSMVADPALVARMPETFARQHRLVPLSFDSVRGECWIAAHMVPNLQLQDQIRCYLGKELSVPMHIHTLMATESDIEQALDACYGYVLALDDVLLQLERDTQGKSGQLEGHAPQQQPVVQLVNLLLLDAIKQQASDIHFEPEQAFVRIRYRIDGVLCQIRSLHGRYWPAMCVRLKLMANLDIAEQRCAQDGRLERFLCGRQIDFRVSTQPTLHGENIVLRVLDRQKAVRPLAEMGLPPGQLHILQQWLKKPQGLLIVTGPTGCGKTTTLYSLLDQLNTEQVNIMTLEDPVEYPLYRIRQTSIQAGNTVDFASGVRALLRQDPDILLLGEIRDEDSAAMALRAAMTGHRVLTTLHTNSALDTFARLGDLGIAMSLLAGNLIGIIGQRLVRRLCPACKVQVSPSATHVLPHACLEQQTPIYQATGCKQCQMRGYVGRMALMELLSFPSDLAFMADEPLHIGRIFEHVKRAGFQSLAEVGNKALLAGETSWQELARVIDLSSLQTQESTLCQPIDI